MKLLTRSVALRGVAVATTTLLIAAPSVGADEAATKNKSTDIPQFSQLDRNSDQRLGSDELVNVPQQKQMSGQELLSKYDKDGDALLNESEYQAMRGALGADSTSQSAPQAAQASRSQPTQAGQKDQQQQTNQVAQNPAAQTTSTQSQNGATITVKEKPAKITVTKPAPQVTVDQAQPDVTITSQDPAVEVDQPEPQVSATQPKPEVSVQQQEPEVVVEEREPEVQISRAEPQVEVEQAPPAVDIRDQDNNELTQQQQSQQQQQQAQNQPRASISGREISSATITEIKSAKVVDSAGTEYGEVAEVVIKQDGSEAGIIVETQPGAGREAQYSYIPTEAARMQENEIVVDLQAAADWSANNDFVGADFRRLPESEENLSEFLGRAELSQR